MNARSAVNILKFLIISNQGSCLLHLHRVLQIMKLFTRWLAQLILPLNGYRTAFKNGEIFHMKISSSSEEIRRADNAELGFLHSKKLPGAEHHLPLCTSCSLHFFPALSALWALRNGHRSPFTGQSSVQNGPCTELQLFLRTRPAFCVVRRWGGSAEFDRLALCLWNPRKCWTGTLYVSAFLFPFSSIQCL